MKFLHPINLVKNELQNARIQNLASDPGSPVVGQIYFNTVDQELKVYTSSGWDVIGKEYQLQDDILKASINGNDLKYAPYDAKITGEGTENDIHFYLGTTAPAGTTRLNLNANLFATRFNDLQLALNNQGFVITGGSAGDKSLTFNNSGSWTGNLALNAWTNTELRMYKNLIIGSTTTGSGSITLLTNQNESPTLRIGATGTANTLPIFDANAALTSLANGTVGQSLRIVDIGAGVLAPRWTTGGSVDQTLVLSFDGGETEGTDLYTYDGSTQKTIDFISGNLITLAKSNNTITVNHDALAAAYATTADTATTLANIEILNSLTVDSYGHVSAAKFRKLVAGTDLTITATSNGNITFAHKTFSTTPATSNASPGFGGTATVIDTLTIDNGHVTGYNTKTITFPTETQLSLVDNGTGTWITGLSLSNHQVTVSRSNTTTAKITVGELLVSKETGVSSGDVVIQGNLTVLGTTTEIHTEELKVKDNIITLNDGATGPALDAGIEVDRGDEDPKYQFLFSEANGDFRIGEEGDLQPVLTRDEVANLEDGDILIWDDTNNRAVGKTFDELNLPNKYAANLTIATGQTYTITHNLNTTDVIVSLKDITSGSSSENEIIYADVKTTAANTITVGFGEINGITTIRVTVIG